MGRADPPRISARRRAARTPGETFFAILVEGELAGLIQYYEENEPDFRHAGIDLFLSARLPGPRASAPTRCERWRAT